ncbi:hypothetical protein ACIPLR_17720 [Herbaspirillum huttiense]|uniref:hypothetical protein n=1 Tax=Herbaspirillum huttiense TaxID=863372 RepID=UPI00381A3452
MGTIRHNAIVVTGTYAAGIGLAADQARKLGLQVLGPSEVFANGYASMLICPDGSNEGWEDSDTQDVLRSKFISWLVSHGTENKQLSWVEIRFGGDADDAIVENDSHKIPELGSA